MKLQFTKAHGSRIIRVGEVEKVGRELERLEKRHGQLTPKIVLGEASKKRSKLHKYFEWDDTKAAKQWRLRQAQQLIKSVDVFIYDVSKDKHVIARAFVSIKNERNESVYVNLPKALSDPEQRAQLLERALWELESWQTRYENLKELVGVFSEITRVRKKRA